MCTNLSGKGCVIKRPQYLILKYIFLTACIHIVPDDVSGGTKDEPSITISKLKPDDHGKYTCTLINGAGETESDEMALTVYCK